MNETPKQNGDGSPSAPRVDGREPGGRFAKGNRLGGGNPLAGAVAKLRGALLRRVKVRDVRGLIDAMIAKGLAGDVAAAKLVLAYTLGAPEQVLTVNDTRPGLPDVEECRRQLLEDNRRLAEWEADALETVQRERHATRNGDGKAGD